MFDEILNSNSEKQVVNLYITNTTNFKYKRDLIKRFIDFDKDANIFYNNLYLNDFKIVLKIPLIEKENSQPEIKIEKFSLVNDIYLTSF